MKAAELETLGRRAAACPRWRWMPGMLSRRHTSQDFDLCRRHSEADCRPAPPTDEYPDLTDPATLGCLLALVRDAYGDPSFVARCVAGLWYEESNTRALVARGSDTEAEALVAALEAAP